MSDLNRFAQVDLSRLPAPNVIETLDYEAIRSEILDALAAAAPDVADVLALESEPLVKLVEIVAYRELTLRARVNDAARAVMLAYSAGSDLEHLAALFGVERLVLDAGDAEASPPVPPALEDDADLRARTQLALEGFSTAGPEGAYIFHARAASGSVKDVAVASPNPGEVIVTILSHKADGTPSAATLDAVTAKLELARPLGDQVTVRGATIQVVPVEASLTLLPGPDASLVMAEAEEALNAYLDRQTGIGRDVTRAGIIAALMVEGVQNVALTAPASDTLIDDLSAAHCPAISLAFGGVDV